MVDEVEGIIQARPLAWRIPGKVLCVIHTHRFRTIS